MQDIGCGCGCSTTTIVTNAQEPCGCGCACCEPEPKSPDQELRDLMTMRQAIDKRLMELGHRES